MVLVRNGDEPVLGDRVREFWKEEESGDSGFDMVCRVGSVRDSGFESRLCLDHEREVNRAKPLWE